MAKAIVFAVAGTTKSVHIVCKGSIAWLRSEKSATTIVTMVIIRYT